MSCADHFECERYGWMLWSRSNNWYWFIDGNSSKLYLLMANSIKLWRMMLGSKGRHWRCKGMRCRARTHKAKRCHWYLINTIAFNRFHKLDCLWNVSAPFQHCLYFTNSCWLRFVDLFMNFLSNSSGSHLNDHYARHKTVESNKLIQKNAESGSGSDSS